MLDELLIGVAIQSRLDRRGDIGIAPAVETLRELGERVEEFRRLVGEVMMDGGDIAPARHLLSRRGMLGDVPGRVEID
jgi:hypothetical protein